MLLAVLVHVLYLEVQCTYNVQAIFLLLEYNKAHNIILSQLISTVT